LKSNEPASTRLSIMSLNTVHLAFIALESTNPGVEKQ